MEEKIIERTGDYIIHQDFWGDRKKYWIVDAVPKGYMIWNIGSHAPEGFIPLCLHDKRYRVDVNSLKVIKCENEEERQYILQAAGWGAGTLRECENNIAILKGSKSIMNKHNLDLLQKALPALKKLRWE